MEKNGTFWTEKNGVPNPAFWTHANFKGKYFYDGLRKKKFEILYFLQNVFGIFFNRKLLSIKHNFLS